jgi:hypothetical protein
MAEAPPSHGEDISGERARGAVDMARVWRDNQRALFALASTNLTDCALFPTSASGV